MYINRADRLRLAISHCSLSKGEIAERAGIHRQMLTEMLANKTPGSKHLQALAKVLNVPEIWLATGESAPPWAQKIQGEFHPPTDEAALFVDICREISFHWRRLQSTSPSEYKKLTAGFSPKITQALSARKKPVSAFRLKLAEIIQLGDQFNLPNIEQREAFEAGFLLHARALQDLHRQSLFASTPPSSTQLPDKVFAVCRAALLAMKAQRQAMRQSWTDVRYALAYLWGQQLGPSAFKNEGADEKGDNKDLIQSMRMDLDLVDPGGFPMNM
jgi:transcriptional regulator with XRE-family HTH domain